MAISAIVTLDIQASEVTTSPGLVFQISTADQFALDLIEGTGLDEIQLAYTQSQTAASNATATISALSLYDERGTVSFSAVKLIYLRNRGPGTAYVGGTFPFGDGDEMELSPGAATLSCDPSDGGYPVDTTGTAFSTFTFRAGADSATCAVDIILLGEGAVTEG